ncbi:J domain-containing protein [Ralstonia insidiosa]|uniref:J domain-containing protein n=1 Tax=Ralstonia insidiosa TaxID=190721 RepID=UPI000CEE1A66|nr:J domain-containing protein [Ralstonia insidiosa]
MFDAYPLQWPNGRPRTLAYNRETGKFDVTFARARDNIVREVTLLCGGRFAADPQIVISTNVALRRDGLPLANQRQPDDVGVAVYFVYKKRQMSFACDRWRKIEHNMQAIAKTIEALRGISRWGTGDMLEAAFTGFAALAAPGATKTWREVLGVPVHERDIEAVRAAFRRQAAEHHPDRQGGSIEKMAAVNAAWQQAKADLGA